MAVIHSKIVDYVIIETDKSYFLSCLKQLVYDY